MKIRKIFFYIIPVAVAVASVSFSPALETGPDYSGDDFARLPLSAEPAAPQNFRQENVDLEASVAHSVPFTAQAAFGNWADDRQNYACEEASVFMAISWARGEGFTLAEAERAIIEISDYELAQYGEFRDTSAQDTLDRIVKGYFGYENAWLIEKVAVEDIIQELHAGNLVIVPVHGQKLNNPFFTFPGPVEHEILITGHDAETGEFIVNDPGTKRGENFRYYEDVLYNAIRDYDTGHHEPIDELRKPAIVIGA